MEQYRIRITRQAREHLLEIRRYIEKELLSPMAAKNTIAAIKAEIQSLSNMPGRVHLTPEEPWRLSGVRRTRVKNYYREPPKTKKEQQIKSRNGIIPMGDERWSKQGYSMKSNGWNV